MRLDKNTKVVVNYKMSAVLELAKQYLLVPIAMILAGLYVKYNKKNLVHRLVDPGDGSPEVMEIAEEPASMNDYLIAVGMVGAIVAVAIFIAGRQGLSLPFFGGKTSSDGNSETRSFAERPIKSVVHRTPSAPRTELSRIPEAIRTGPANF